MASGNTFDEQKAEKEGKLKVIQEAINACQFGDLKKLKLLCEQRNVNVNTVDEQECSLVHWAGLNNRKKVISYLVDKGADLNVLGGTFFVLFQ